MPCAVLPRHQVHAGICHTGSAQRRSPHYPLWTRTDVISLSVSLSSLFPPSFCLTLASFLSLSPPFFFYLSVYLNLILFLSSFLTLHPLSLSLFDPLSYIVSLSSACGLISLVCCWCCLVTEPACHAWVGGLGWLTVTWRRAGLEGGGVWRIGVLKGKCCHPAIR